MTESDFNPEKCIVGCLLLGEDAGRIFAELPAEDFENEEWRALYVALEQFWQRHGEITPEVMHTLPEGMKPAALYAFQTIPAASSWALYVSQVKEAAILRRATEITFKIAMRQDAGLDELREMADKLMQVLNNSTNAKSLDMRTGLLNFMREKASPRQYIKTGFSILDRFTYLDRGDFIIIGGRPSSGKTAFSLNISTKIAQNGHKVVYFSLETGNQKVMDRIVTNWCSLDFSAVKRQELSDQEWGRVAFCGEELAKIPMEIVKASGKTVSWVRAEAMRRNASIVVVDYIGLIHDPGKSRYEKMTNISMELHNFAQQTGTTVIALSQLNRGGADRPPCMEDLRESGQIEQDADVILLLHNDTDYKVIIAKNKEGETGEIPMDFDGKRQTFHEVITREAPR